MASALSPLFPAAIRRFDLTGYDLDLEDEDYTTIAGLVTTEAGHVPKKGEHLDLRGLAIEVLDADEKRVNLLRLRRSTPAEDATEH